MKDNCVSVSVVIPLYNGGDHVREAIASVHAQTLSPAEIIVVDDGSTDGSGATAKLLGARVIHQQNLGVCAARNAGIRAATNEWIAFLDQDDVWMPDKIERQWEAVKRYSDVGIVSCLMEWFEPELETVARVPAANDSRSGIKYLPKVERELPLSRTVDNPSSILVRRDHLLAVGLFDEELRQNEDLELFLRLITRCSLAVVDRVLIEHRVHRGSRSQDVLESGLSFIKVVDKVSADPNKYPASARGVYEEHARQMLIPLGRSLLAAGRHKEARALFARSLKDRYSNRALMLWAFSFTTRKVFKTLTDAKARFSSLKAGNVSVAHSVSGANSSL